MFMHSVDSARDGRGTSDFLHFGEGFWSVNDWLIG